MTDQQRFDTIRFIQEEMDGYSGKMKIETPNIDRLAQRGVYFRKTYCHSPTCGPSRATLRSGCTIERTGIQSNNLVMRKWEDLKESANKVLSLQTYDQLLVEERGYVAEVGFRGQ
jgi:arylsulfatase A-like enzyme